MKKNKRLSDAAELERQAKALRKSEKNFWAEVEERVEEISEKYGDKFQKNVPNKWNEICSAYGAASPDEATKLFEHIVSKNQIDYYSRRVKNNEGVEGV